MTNVKLDVSGQVLTITVLLSHDGGPSASGKSQIIGTTSGNVAVPGHPDIKLGLNIYRKR